jgi:hypothetical protein
MECQDDPSRAFDRHLSLYAGLPVLLSHAENAAGGWSFGILIRTHNVPSSSRPSQTVLLAGLCFTEIGMIYRGE